MADHTDRLFDLAGGLQRVGEVVVRADVRRLLADGGAECLDRLRMRATSAGATACLKMRCGAG